VCTLYTAVAMKSNTFRWGAGASPLDGADPELDDEITSDEESVDVEDSAGHDRLLAAIDKFAQNTEDDKEYVSRRNRIDTGISESAFASAAGAVSMESLLGALEKTKGISVVKQQLSAIKDGSNAPKPVEKTILERKERSLLYEASKNEMSKWQGVVVANRNVKTLDLTADKRKTPNYRNLVTKFTPTSDMEKEVNMVLVGLSESNVEKQEMDELGAKYEDIDEIRARQGELAKVRSLMFYEQMKRHRLNKIKSKAYHRIRNKQKKRLQGLQDQQIAATDPELAKQMEEEEMTRRVKERMDLRHKNTGK
jgi:U3 small nucleolar RNA-associated protein 14